MSALFVRVDAFFSNDVNLFISLKSDIKSYIDENSLVNTYNISMYDAEFFDKVMAEFKVNSLDYRYENDTDQIFQMLTKFKDNALIILAHKEEIDSLSIQRKNSSDIYQVINVKVSGRDLIEVVTDFDQYLTFEDNLTNIQNSYLTLELASIITTAHLNEKRLQNLIQESNKSLDNSCGILEIIRSSKSSVDTSLQNQILEIENEIKQISSEAISGIDSCDTIKRRLLVEKDFENQERDDENFIRYPTRFNINQLTLKHEASPDWSKHIFTVKNNSNYSWHNLSIVFVKNNSEDTTFGNEHYGERLCEIEVIKPHEENKVSVGYTDKKIETLGFYKVQIFYHSQPVSNTVDLSSISVMSVQNSGEKARIIEFKNNIRELENCKAEVIHIKTSSSKVTNIKKIPTRTLGKLPLNVVVGDQYIVKFSKDGLLLSEPYTFKA